MYLNIDHNLLVASSSLVCLMYANANASCYNFLFLYLYYNILHDINIILLLNYTTTLYIMHFIGTITITVTLTLT